MRVARSAQRSSSVRLRCVHVAESAVGLLRKHAVRQHPCRVPHASQRQQLVPKHAEEAAGLARL
eukprot:1820189-Pleurochrysis_carterae.AAC.1